MSRLASQEEPQGGGAALVRRKSHGDEEGPQCGGGARVRRSQRELIGHRGGATVRKSGLSENEEPR